MSLSNLFNPIYFPILNLHKKKKKVIKRSILNKKSIPNTPVVKPVPHKSIEHCCFLDWDDTLMPSSYLLSKIEIGVVDYELNEKTNRIKGFNYKLNEELTEREQQEFILNVQKTGQAAFALLTEVIATVKPTNIKIVTNSVKGWLHESLYICAGFCAIFYKIKQMLDKYKIEIIYARNSGLNKAHWKTVCFNRLLCEYFSQTNIISNNNNNEKRRHLNIISIGDQWTDHKTIEQTLCFRINNNSITHHQVKLLTNPDCRYLAIELQYIVCLFDQKVLFSPQEQGLIFEFDGYN
eukprot:404178_1